MHMCAAVPSTPVECVGANSAKPLMESARSCIKALPERSWSPPLPPPSLTQKHAKAEVCARVGHRSCGVFSTLTHMVRCLTLGSLPPHSSSSLSSAQRFLLLLLLYISSCFSFYLLIPVGCCGLPPPLPLPHPSVQTSCVSFQLPPLSPPAAVSPLHVTHCKRGTQRNNNKEKEKRPQRKAEKV
jgi:hypothetical protein